MTELTTKLARVRANMRTQGLGAIRFRGVDWFAWMTCGGSSTVILSAETGVAEVLVTDEGAWVLTDNIEAERLAREELPGGLPVEAHPWTDSRPREAFVKARTGVGPVGSDRPVAGEFPLPVDLTRARSSLGPEELERYRALGRDAAAAMTDVLLAARPEWTGFELAGAGAQALWARGIHPMLTLVGDARRLPVYRHPTASRDTLGDRAMLVFCGRRRGLCANLTRFVYFRQPSREERRLAADVARVEAAAFAASRPGATLGQVYAALVRAYADAGHPGAQALHHQGGSCGYLSRDVVALPDTGVALEPHNAVAWNPSLPGAKIEDTAVVSPAGLELLTVDPRWPTVRVEGLERPDLLVR
ncbi:M24 family metallopeptidase [Corallococcus exercitus]|uniref:M24 family metallopeptidase n=1 Tax=Corallococcus exercitus TaxID=2316736 RepID=UPI000EA21025|nr:aminopeptidase P family protein [Corallococcus exercitus]RKG81204.1 M24 family metallopeptidase [Corallococcus exercitus]